jgi:membrane associated rhomboid family serine protease
MDRLLARLERNLGRFAIERLPTFIVGGMALVFVLAQAKPELIDHLTLDPARALKEPWRFVTYLFIPTSTNLIWVLFSLYWTWLVGQNLENEWGAFKLNLYYFLGALGTTAAAWITKEPQGNFWLNTSLFFAFATVFPNYEIYIFFVIPIRVKWLGLLTLAFVGFQFVVGDLGVKTAIAVALGNYLLFFGGHLVRLARGQQVQMRQAARRTALRRDDPGSQRERERVRDAEPDDARATKVAGRTCAMCGARQDDGADIRVCTCEKCGAPRELCLEHARNH